MGPDGRDGPARVEGVLRGVFCEQPGADERGARRERKSKISSRAACFLVFVNRWMALIVSGLLAYGPVGATRRRGGSRLSRGVV